MRCSDDVDIYLFSLSRLPPDFDTPQVRSVLTSKEQESLAAIKSERRYREYLAGHLFTRLLLGEIGGEAWSDISLHTDVRGKPYAVGPGIVPVFNISHAGDYLAIAVAMEGRLGVDIDVVDSRLFPVSELLAIADRHFTDEEYALLQQLPTQDVCHHFYRIWTTKEAVLKAVGYGLVVCPLRDINAAHGEVRSTHYLGSHGRDTKLETEYIYLAELDCHLSVAREKKLGRVSVFSSTSENLQKFWDADSVLQLSSTCER